MSSMLLPDIHINFYCLWSCQNYIRKVSRIWGYQLVFPDQKPKKHQFPKFLGEIFEKKVVFTGIITFLPCVNDKVKLKSTRRIINIIGEKRACRLHGLRSILHCPEVHRFLPSERPCSQVLPCGNQLDIHSYSDLKLGHTAFNNKYNY